MSKAENKPKRKRHDISDKEVRAIKSLDREQLWLLSVQRLAAFDFKTNDGALRKLLGVTDDQMKAVENVITHYSIGIAVRGVSPAGVVGELIDLDINPDYAVLLADTAAEVSYRIRLVGKTRSYFSARGIQDILERLERIDTALTGGTAASKTQ